MMILKMLTITLTIFAIGCSRNSIGDHAKHATNKAGQIIGESAGTFISGVGAGVDKAITTYDVRLSEELLAKGVSVTIAKHTDGTESNNWQQGLSFYVINKTAVSGTLRMKLFNDKTQEIGRAVTDISTPADNANFIPFTLAKEVPVSMTRYVELDLKQEGLLHC